MADGTDQQAARRPQDGAGDSEPETCPHPDDKQTTATWGRAVVQTCGQCGQQWAVEP